MPYISLTAAAAVYKGRLSLLLKVAPVSEVIVLMCLFRMTLGLVIYSAAMAFMLLRSRALAMESIRNGSFSLS